MLLPIEDTHMRIELVPGKLVKIDDVRLQVIAFLRLVIPRGFLA
jgi:hypothetical protein